MTNIRSLVPLATRFVLILVAVWACFILLVWALSLANQYSILVTVIKIGAVVPIFLSIFLVEPFLRTGARHVSLYERVTLFALAFPAIALAAVFIEATAVFLLTGPGLDMAYLEALLQPPGKRLNMVIAWGLTFLQLSLIASAVSLLLFFPLRVAMALKKPTSGK